MLTLTYSRIADDVRYEEPVASCEAAVAFVINNPDIDDGYVADHDGAWPKLHMTWDQMWEAVKPTRSYPIMDYVGEVIAEDDAFRRQTHCPAHSEGHISDVEKAIDMDHYCEKHSARTGEGDICAECEREYDNYRMLMNLEMSKHQYQLWFMIDKRVIYKCPVDNFDDAKTLFNSLSRGNVSGVRIARHDTTEGCESVLHKFQ